MQPLHFSDELREKAAGFVTLLNNKILPGMSALENNLSAYKEPDGALMKKLCDGISSAMDYNAVAHVRNILQAIARNDEVLFLDTRTSFEALYDLRGHSAFLTTLGYYQKELQDLANFVAGSEEISGHFLRAQQERKAYQQSKKKPYILHLPDEVKEAAARLNTQIDAARHERHKEMGLIGDETWAATHTALRERQKQTGLSDDDIFERNETIARERLLNISAPFHFHMQHGKCVAAHFKTEVYPFECAQDAVQSLEELFLCARSLAGHGRPDVQQFLDKNNVVFTAAMEEAKTAARNELSGNKKSINSL